MDRPFLEYFTDKEIIKLICKYRLKHARKRHKIHMLRDISKHSKTNLISDEKFACPDELKSLLPSRRKWSRLNESNRRKLLPSGKSVIKDSQDVSLESLVNTVLFARKNPSKFPNEKWIANLNAFIKDILGVIHGSNPIHINSPEIVPIDKGGRSKSAQYRPIASYILRDRIIISLCSKYLMSIFDDHFDDCSHAFRKKKGMNHHSAVQAIQEYKARYPLTDLWATECDIQKFYDSVNHRLIKKTFVDFVHEIGKLGHKVDERASDIFFDYLSSYCFNVNVSPLSNSDEHFQKFKMRTGAYKWIETKNLYPEGIEEERIGVPQGGAISCLIANLLLNSVDKKVLRQNKDPELFYVRYCDDMVIIHPNKRKCLTALGRYKRALTDAKLIFHNDQKNPKYGKEFWKDDLKSKPPYRWSPTDVPWLNFVGYQVRFNLDIRVREKSIVKEIKKQRSETNRVLKAIDILKARTNGNSNINENSRKSIAQLVHSLRSRLIAMSVGRITLHNYIDHSYGFCWANGFQQLNYNKYSRHQLSLLDRTRERQLCRLKKNLKGLELQSNNSDENNKVYRYYGTPFSYFRYILAKSNLAGLRSNQNDL